jgi:hypothetical protein
MGMIISAAWIFAAVVGIGFALVGFAAWLCGELGAAIVACAIAFGLGMAAPSAEFSWHDNPLGAYSGAILLAVFAWAPYLSRRGERV